MHLLIPHNLLLKATDLVAKGADKHHRFVILGNVKIELTDTCLILTTSDLEVELTTTLRLPEGACLERGELTLPAGKFHDICKSLPKGGNVSLKTLDEGRCLIESGKSRFTLSSLPASDFPSIGTPKQDKLIRVYRNDLLNMIAHTKFCIATQDVRHYLTGMLFHVQQDMLTLVATDGHRLAITQRMLADTYENNQIIVPGKAVGELERLFVELGKTLGKDDLIHLGLDSEFLQIKLNFGTLDEQGLANDDMTVAMTARLIEGSFPEYQRVIPTDFDKKAYFDKDAMMDVLRRVSILSNDRHRGVLLQFESDVLTIRSNTSGADSDEAVESLSVRYEGEPTELSFNEAYLKAVFGVLSGEICLSMNQPNSPTLVTQIDDERHRYIVMPIRI